MKEYLAELVRAAGDSRQARHLVREYLQARLLNSLQRAGAMVPLAFHGRTALRFLYQIPRISEDLDFALEHSAGQYDFRAYLKEIRSDLAAENYAVDLRVNDRKVVHSAFVRFRGLLFELDLSPHADETVSIKIEVDTRPPAGAGLKTTVVRRHVVLNLQRHDKASLLAGKLHAILQRPYGKGRDLYDLFWYLSDPEWPFPNFALLNNALAQDGWRGGRIAEENWRAVVRRRVAEIDWEAALAEARALVVDPAEVDLLTQANMSKLLADV
jgi:hypothetical protein